MFFLIIILNCIDINSHFQYYTDMYVCICNNLTSKKIEQAVNEGVSNTKNIYSYYNCSPKCGKCLSFVDEMLSNKGNFSVKNT